jgi:hypothetical protein
MPKRAMLAKSKKPKQVTYTSLNPPREKLQPKTNSTNESEIRMQELVKHYQHEVKRKPNIAIRRSYLSSEQINNYRNELDRLTGEMHNNPHLSALDRSRLVLRKTMLSSSIENNRLPLIGVKGEYKYI